MTIENTIRVCAGLGLLSIAPSIYSQTLPGAGQIAGVVRDSSGNPLSDVRVMIMVRPTGLGASFLPYNRILITGADGTYRASGVPAGTFAVCAFSKDSTVLAPCTWGTEPKVSIAAGQSMSAPAIQLHAGVDLHVRVNDPLGKLAAAARSASPPAGAVTAPAVGQNSSPTLTIAVRSPNGALIPIPRVSSDSTGADHHISVPPDTPLHLVIVGNGLSLTDENGAAIGGGGLNVPITIPANQQTQTHTVNIGG